MASSPPLLRGEWDFSEKRVPNEELRACLIWECCRECGELISVDEYETAEHTAKMGESPEEREEASQWLNEFYFDVEKHYERLNKCREGYNSFYYDALRYARPWNEPWQQMSADFRQNAVRRLEDWGPFQPMRPALTYETEQHWQFNGREILECRLHSKSQRERDRLEFLEFQETVPVQLPKDECDPEDTEAIAAFAINFSNFTDGEIVEAFEEWLDKNRPCAAPIRRGKKRNDDRAALEGIGAMRALSRWPVSHKAFPAELSKRGRRSCYKGRMLALRRYHELLPFLPLGSKPIHWETACKR